MLLSINGLHSTFFDWFMMLITGKLIWIPLYALFAMMLIRKCGFVKGLYAILLIALMITAIDWVCAGVIRPGLERLRPSNPDNPISEMLSYVNNYRCGKYGMPSCHAANTFALALFLSLIFKNKLITFGLILWSLAIGYSRVYLGVHYPGDILAGCAIGGSLAYAFYRIYLLIYHGRYKIIPNIWWYKKRKAEG